MRAARVLAVALLAAVASVAVATDSPHDASSPTGTAINCESCHIGHAAPDGSLTSILGNFNLCSSCHTPTAGTTGFGFPWNATGPGGGDQAGAGSRGRHHRWDANPTNLGASAPSSASSDPVEATMARHLASTGKIQCSTCHDQHQSDIYRTDATVHVSTPAPTLANFTLTVGAVPATAAAKGYLIDIVTQGTPTAARFRLSNDGGLSWFGCTAPTTYTYVAYTGANTCQAGPNIALNDGANVTVTFGGTTLNVGDRQGFYVSYPYLRADNTASRMCITCHKDRDMRWQDVRGGAANGYSGVKTVTLGVTVFHHPTSQALGANSGNYDRANQGAILDADGSAQSAGTEGRKSNDLVLSSTGLVGCMTCHHPHNADSNSLSSNPR